MRIVGATGSRAMRSLIEQESRRLEVNMSPGDPVPAYRASDLFVLPTLEDGFGYVVAEAMACGVPAVVTDACGAAEWVTDGETGWIVPARSTEALAAALEAARSKKDGLAVMGSRARESIVRRMQARPAETYGAWLSPQYMTTEKQPPLRTRV